MTEIAIRDPMQALEAAVTGGDLSQLTPAQRMTLYVKKCESVGLNPFSQPFDYVEMDKKLVLYANKGCVEQLRRIHKVNARIITSDEIHDCYRVVVEVTEMETGRAIVSTGLVPLMKENGSWKTSQSGKRYLEKDGTLSGLTPVEFCNAVMKAETKAYRRATLALLGLGILDESELDTIPDARPANVNVQTGEIVTPQVEAPKPTNGTSKPPASAQSNTRPSGRGPFYCADCGDAIRARMNVAMKDGSLKTYQPIEIAQRTFDKYGLVLCWDHSNNDGVTRAKAKIAQAPDPFPGVVSADDEPEEDVDAAFEPATA